MKEEDKHICQLVEDVLAGRISPEKAVIEAASPQKEENYFEGLCNNSHLNLLQLIMHKVLERILKIKGIFFKNDMYVAVAICDDHMAFVHEQLGQYDKSLDLYKSARNIFAENGQDVDAARCDLNMAIIYQHHYPDYESLDLYKSAREVFADKKKKVYVARCDMNMAAIYLDREQYDKAFVLSKSARDIFAKKGQDVEAAGCDLNMAVVYQHRGQYDQSLVLCKSAREVFVENKKKVYVAGCDMNMAAVYQHRGQYDESLDLYKSARETFAQNDRDVDVAKCDLKMANIYQHRGQYDESLDLYKSAREVFAEKKRKVDVASCDLNMAVIYQHRGQYDESLDLYNSAREVFVKNDRDVDVAMCDLNVANLHHYFNQNNKSLNLYNSAREVFVKNNKDVYVATCNLNIAVIYQHRGQYDDSLDLYKFARDTFAKNGRDVGVAGCDLNMATVYLARDQYDEFPDLCKSAREVFVKNNRDFDVAVCDINMAHLYDIFCQYADALSLLQRVKDKYGHLPWIKWESLYVTGNIYKKLGDYERAKASYAEAIEVIEGIWKIVPGEDFRISFLDSKYTVYYQMIELCLQQKEFNKALEYVERAKSKNLADLIASRDFLKRERTEEEQKRFRISYSEIEDLVVDDNGVLIELYPMLSKTVVFIMSGDRDREATVVDIPDYNYDNLIKDIESLLIKYANYQTEENNFEEKNRLRKVWSKHLDDILSNLYEKFFLRIRPYLKKDSKIIMIPYSAFHLLPLHAMYTEINGQKHYVIDKYPVKYAPSARILKQCSERERNAEGKALVAYADPNLQNTYRKLQFAAFEAKHVKDIFNNSEYIEKATREDIISRSGDASIFHYSGHAQFGALHLHSQNDMVQKELYGVEDILATLDLSHAHLATLSACETGMTELLPVDEYLGLPSAFLSAGAATVVSSLWNVNDISTCMLMQKMYENIKQGKSTSESLREAQLWLKDPKKREDHVQVLSEYIKTQNWSINPEKLLPDDLDHPYHWAGFYCSGAD